MIWQDVITESLPGPTRLRVRGRSMLPTLRPGDEVVVHPVTAEALAPGDWVALRGGFLHRYLGRRKGRVVTKGDGHKALDPAWPPDAVLGRVVEAQRDGQCFYRRTPGQLRRERLLAAGHHTLGDVWGVLRRVKALFLALFALALAASLAWAAVTLTSFTAKVDVDAILLNWETASETSNLGFRLWRSLDADTGYVDISDFIDSLDEGAGALYEYEDTDVTPGITYYYQLEDLPVDGSSGDYTDPISATIPADDAPTLTPTLETTPTPTSTPQPTATPNPNVRFWADKTDLTAGECATLYWQTNNITAIHFDGVGVAGDGERAFCPCVTESHTLRVKYISGATEDFVITLNVTGQCGATAPTSAPATFTPTIIPRATPFDTATATPRPTSTPGASPTQAVAAATATLAATSATAAGAEAQATSTDIATDALPADAMSSPAAATSSLLPTRGLVEGESPGVPVEKMLSVWLLIIGGIVGAGFVGAGILMWKRQQ